MSAFAVKQGDVVQQGQIIGYVGDTGYAFGCHCHFEMFGPGGRFSAQLLFPTL
ncbi:MAG: M23 family metallopeptidase [Subdoligranulum sp.]|nr:M23 family metallopeptidase [Subdoligranulum sp.]